MKISKQETAQNMVQHMHLLSLLRLFAPCGYPLLAATNQIILYERSQTLRIV